METQTTQSTQTKTRALLKKGRRGLIRALFGRTGLVTLLLLLQFGLLLAIFVWLRDWQIQYFGGTAALTVLMVIRVINSRLDPSAKITWLVTIMAMPVFGSLFYLYTQRDMGHRLLRDVTRDRQEESRGLLRQSLSTSRALRAADPGAAALARYVRRSGSYSVFRDTQVTYFPSGEEKFGALLEELERAERFIFLEYFIVDEGVMWGSVLDVLARKAAQGVDVRVMYDGTCEFTLLPRDYPQRMQKLGIQCRAFSPVQPFISTHYNYRDHRKIAVIDGRVAFNGGVNLADEYINKIEKYGHWKDTAVMLRGRAVSGFTLMFLQMWGGELRSEQTRALLDRAEPVQAPGFVMPYGDSPLDGDQVGEQVYLDMLSRAKRYVHIMTPI